MSFEPTPDPTDTEFLETLCLVDGGVFPALQELVNRLKANIPAKTTALNARLGLTGDRAIPIPKPESFGVAPRVLSDAYVNSVLVGGATTTREQGFDAFQNETQVVVYSIGARIEDVQQLQDAHHRAAIIRGVLYHFRSTTVDDSGRVVWRVLAPTGVSLLPSPMDEYSGCACYFRMVQPPVENYWQEI